MVLQLPSRANPIAVRNAAAILRDEFYSLQVRNWAVYTTARARKPSAYMLRRAKATEYWGDSDEDGLAAAAAGITFKRIERFTV